MAGRLPRGAASLSVRRPGGSAPAREEHAAVMDRTLLAVVVALCASTGLRAQEDLCAIPEDERAWTQRALDAWERGSRDLLRTSPTPLPWIVLVGPRCSWHLGAAEDATSFPDEAMALEGGADAHPGWTLAGQEVKVRAVPHRGRVHLPDGGEIAAKDPTAGARLRREGKETFFTMSTLEVWRRAYPEMPESDLQPFFLGVFSHEIVHT